MHLGIAEENRILEMSGLFFQQILKEIGYKLNYEAVVNFAGNSFMEKAWEYIQKSNPLMLKDGKAPNPEEALGAMNDLIGQAGLTIMSSPQAMKETDEETKQFMAERLRVLSERKEEANDKG